MIPNVYVKAAADAIYDESIQVGHLVLRDRGTVYPEVTWTTKVGWEELDSR